MNTNAEQFLKMKKTPTRTKDIPVFPQHGLDTLRKAVPGAAMGYTWQLKKHVNQGLKCDAPVESDVDDLSQFISTASMLIPTWQSRRTKAI